MKKINCPQLTSNEEWYLISHRLMCKEWSSLSEDKGIEESIRSKLTGASNSTCWYCEKCEAKTVEHFKPKSRFPGETWNWEDFLWACSNCQDKDDDAISQDTLNPRNNDPLDYLFIEPQSGEIVTRPLYNKPGSEIINALHFDTRSDLNDLRKLAYTTFTQQVNLLLDKRASRTHQIVALEILAQMLKSQVFNGVIRQTIYVNDPKNPFKLKVDQLRKKNSDFDNLLEKYILPPENHLSQIRAFIHTEFLSPQKDEYQISIGQIKDRAILKGQVFSDYAIFEAVNGEMFSKMYGLRILDCTNRDKENISYSTSWHFRAIDNPTQNIIDIRRQVFNEFRAQSLSKTEIIFTLNALKQFLSSPLISDYDFYDAMEIPQLIIIANTNDPGKHVRLCPNLKTWYKQNRYDSNKTWRYRVSRIDARQKGGVKIVKQVLLHLQSLLRGGQTTKEMTIQDIQNLFQSAPSTIPNASVIVNALKDCWEIYLLNAKQYYRIHIVYQYIVSPKTQPKNNESRWTFTIETI